MNTDKDVMPNGLLNVAKPPTNSVSMSQLYRDKQLSEALPMHSEPSLSTMYNKYMIQQTSDNEKSMYDHDKDIVAKVKTTSIISSLTFLCR